MASLLLITLILNNITFVRATDVAVITHQTNNDEYQVSE